ncbi:RHS repeat-associated core domain-containing protein, partial [Pseudoalteromonas sp. S558]|uniref:RHS repeat-associated core domain-containing protein n=1 Tax=Pseudoalteromonas sp. S558 TaxID=2066515 RepID=UPI001271D3CD
NVKKTQKDYYTLWLRIAKHTEHGKIDYIWDNDQLIGEYQHGEYTWYINLPNQFHPVALIKKGEVYYYHLDQLNTPRFVTNSKAEVVWENQADVYGYEELKAESDFNKESSFTQPIRFQGQYLDEESGLHYNRYRYYSPKQQRFINQDPIGLVGGINHYQYAPNPVNWVDPFGLLCKEGEKRLKKMLNTLVGNGFDQETVDAIFKIAIACTPIDNQDISTIDYPPEGGVYRKKHEYSFEKIRPEENNIIITRETPSGNRISQTVSIEDFAKQHIDNNEKVANIHFGKILEEEHGVAKPSPEEMENAHAHHIVFKEGSGKQKEWVLKSKAILEEYKIDWLKGPENLVWAPNIEGLHTEEMAKKVYGALQQAHDLEGTPEAVTDALSKMGKLAANHTRGKKYI